MEEEILHSLKDLFIRPVGKEGSYIPFDLLEREELEDIVIAIDHYLSHFS